MGTAPLLSDSSKPMIHPETLSPEQNDSATFRSLRLQLFPQLTKWAHRKEPKKTAIHRSQDAALLHLLLHIVPLSVGIAFASLNIRTHYIGLMTSNGLTAIQFASKLVEVSAQASITSIVLAFARNRTLGKAGLPFGGFVVPFQTTYISSLWSLELWGCLTSTSTNLMIRLVAFFFFATAIILAALIGPSSAVLMIPRPVSRLGSLTLFMYPGGDRIFPPSVDLVGERLSAESDFNGSYFQLDAGINIDDWPIPITDHYGSRNFQYTKDQTYWQHGSLGFSDFRTDSIVATMPSLASLKGLGTWSSSRTTNRMAQPYVYFACEDLIHKVNVTDRTHQYVDFGRNKSFLNSMLTFNELMPNFTKPTNDDSIETMSVSWLSKWDKSWKNASMVWSTPPAGISNTSLVTVFSYTSPPYSDWSIQPCSVHAYWSTVTANISSDHRVSNELPANLYCDDLQREVLSNLDTQKVISLSPKWAKRSVAVSAEVTNSSDLLANWLNQGFSYALALSYIPQLDSDYFRDSLMYSKKFKPKKDGRYSINDQQFDTLLDYVETNKLVSKYDTVEVWIKEENWTDPATFARSEIRDYDIGYGYDTSTITVRLSLAVMAVYLVATVAYLLYTLVTGEVATSWDSVAELVTLALNSQKPKCLENTSVGIDTLETFRRPVNIRVNQDDSLEIRFDAPDHSESYARVKPNEKY